MSITDFLLARIAEDEARAGWARLGDTRWETDNYGQDFLTPTAVKAECVAKRAIIESCYGDHEDAMASKNDSTEAASEVLYALAAVYKDHSDYQQEWSTDAI